MDNLANNFKEFDPSLITPASNNELFGFADIEADLLKMFNENRLPHAIVLTGIPGIGKATLAYRFIKFLLVEGGESSGGLFGDDAKPTSLAISNDNPIIDRVISGGHSDLHLIMRELDPKTGKLPKEIKVDQIRKINKFARKTSAEGGWKIILIDEAETLNRNAQNALLKILEEPPKKTLIILVSSKPGLFLPTIRSRCRFIKMDKLSEDNAIRILSNLLPDTSQLELKTLIRLSDGSVGKAIELNESNGIASFQELLSILDSLPNLDLFKTHKLSEKLASVKEDINYKNTMDLFIWWLDRMMKSKLSGEEIIEIIDGETQIIDKVYNLKPLQKWIETRDNILDNRNKAEISNLDRRQVILSSLIACK